MSQHVFPLESSALESAAVVHHNFAQTAEDFLTAHRHNWEAINALVTGEAFETGKTKLAELAKNLFNNFALSTNLADLLYTAAKAQRDLERQYDRLTTIAQTFGLHITGFLVVPGNATGVAGAAAVMIQLHLLIIFVNN